MLLMHTPWMYDVVEYINDVVVIAEVCNAC